MKINTTELNRLYTELNSLMNNAKHDKTDERRMAYLQTAISAVKAGASLQEIEQESDNERRSRVGLPSVKSLTSREAEARGWQAFIEQRDMTEDAADAKSRIGTYTSLGYFVPTDFFQGLFTALKDHDVLFNDADCTVIHSTNGRPLPVPVAGDTENVASVINEAGSQTSVDIDVTTAVTIGAYSYSTPRMVVSSEAFQDVDATLNAVSLFKRFTADRIARGVGADMLNGNGSGKTLGLLTSLANLGTPIITAAGSSVNDGSANTGANSLGSDDFKAAFADLDSAYVASDKCAWIMNQKTLANVAGIVTKYGQPLELVKYVNGVPTIFGVPVKISPSMPNIGASAIPVVLGDFSYWATRLIADGGIGVYTEAPGLVENGNVGLRSFVRADGALLYNDSSSPSPFITIRNHS